MEIEAGKSCKILIRNLREGGSGNFTSYVHGLMEEEIPTNGENGDVNLLYIAAGIGALVVILLIVLFIRRRK